MYECMFCLFTAGIALLVVHILVKPFQRGFFCDDQTIQHPYKEDTVPMVLCAAIGVTIAITSVRHSLTHSLTHSLAQMISQPGTNCICI